MKIWLSLKGVMLMEVTDIWSMITWKTTALHMLFRVTETILFTDLYKFGN